QCQQERSQHKNRDKAMQLLKAKLYQHYERLQQEEHKKLEAEKKDIAWGSQIRSYVFHPYNLIKDHRTGYETSNVDKIMDGYLDDYIFEYLKWDLKKSFA
ncbi:MAG: peptide chain release factor 2, partial [Spirochaetae bacterium HGW-Spirochaetae-6]